ncbi:unnamed protein product [Schistosoma turkestanicum]|nr:unnamed protein product [Schistosoma turkestanicum]
MDVRIKYPFKHFLKEGTVSKPMKKRIEVNNSTPTDITGSKDDENALTTSSDNQSHVNYRKRLWIMKRKPTFNRHPNSNRNIIEEDCYGIQPGLSQTEITKELIRYAQMIKEIQQTNPQLFLRKHQ